MLLCHLIHRNQPDRVLFMWPVKIPAADGRTSEWNVSAATAAQHAMKGWVRVKSNMGLGAYEILKPKAAFRNQSGPNCRSGDRSDCVHDRVIRS